MPRIVTIDSACIHLDTLNVVEDKGKGLFYLTATCSKLGKPEHRVIANLAQSTFKSVLEELQKSFQEQHKDDGEDEEEVGVPKVYNPETDMIGD